MRALVLWVAVLVSMSAYSQTSSQQLDLASLPETPSTSKVLSANSEEHSSAAFIVQPVTPTVPSLVIRPAQPEAKGKIDRNFIIATVFQIGATVADIESTQHGLSHGAKEGNPLFGERP